MGKNWRLVEKLILPHKPYGIRINPRPDLEFLDLVAGFLGFSFWADLYPKHQDRAV